MQKINVTEHELRKIVAKAIITEAGIDPTDPRTVFSRKSKVSWEPKERLALLGELVGGAAIASSWWQNVLKSCSPLSAPQTSADGASVSSDPRFSDDISKFGIDDAAAFKALLNFAIVSVLCGKKVQARSQTPLGSGPEPALALTPKKTYDIIQKNGSNNLFVYPNDALVSQCSTYFTGTIVLKFDDPTFVTEILNDDAAVNAVITNKMSSIEDGPPSENTCFSSMPDAQQKEYTANLRKTITDRQDKIISISKELSSEVYEAYLYTPLLAPRVWLNADLSPSSPLYTPWRMTWSACNLIGQVLSKYPNDRDTAIIAMLTNLAKIVRTGTSINIYDATGEEFAMGEVESTLEEAAFFVGGVLLTEDKLRRIIHAALSANLNINEMDTGKFFRGAADVVGLGGVVRTGEAVVDVAAAAASALAKQNEELEGIKDASKALEDYSTSVRTGRIIQSVTKSTLAEEFLSEVGTLQQGLTPLYRKLASSIAVDPFNSSSLGAAAIPSSAEIAAQLGTSDKASDAISSIYQKIIQINLKRSVNASADISTELDEINILARDIPDEDAAKIAALPPDEILQSLGTDLAIQNANTNLLRSAGTTALLDDMKKQSATWLDAQLAKLNAQSKVNFEVSTANSIEGFIPKFVITPASPPAPVSLTLSTTEFTTLGRFKTELDAALKSAIPGNSSAAVASRQRLFTQYVSQAIGLSDEQIQMFNQSTQTLSRDEFYNTGVTLIVNGAYKSSGSALRQIVGNKTAVGVLAGAKEQSKVTRALDAIAGAVDYAVGSDPSKGIIPYFGADVSIGWKTINGQRIQAGILTKRMWEAIAAERVAIKTGNTVASSGKPGSWANIIKFSAAYTAAFAYESAMIVSRLKAQTGQRAAASIAKATATSLPRLSRGITRTIHSKWGALIGAMGTGVLTSVITWAIGSAFSENFSKKSEEGDSDTAKVLKTVMNDLTRNPIEFRHGGINILSGGPVVVVVKAILDLVKDTPEIEDFNNVLNSLDAKNPLADAKKRLVDAVSNMFKNAILDSDNNNITSLFPDLEPGASVIGPEADKLIQKIKEITDYTLDVTLQTYRADPSSRITLQNLKSQIARGKQQVEALRAEVDKYKSQQQSFGTSIEGAAELEDNEAIRLAIINDTISGIQNNSGIDISRWRSQAIPNTFGRENVDESAGNIGVLSTILANSAQFFDFSTTILEFSGNPDPTVGISAAAQGTFGLEFTGDIPGTDKKTSDAVASETFASLSVLWNESGKAVAGALSAVSQ